MASGLYIERGRDFHVGRWLFVLTFIGLLGAAGWSGFKWYTTGEKPPIFPLPASALADPSVDETPLSQADIDGYKVDRTHPRYISIPALGITKARVQSVGLTDHGMLDTPRNIADAAWYKDGAYPGEGYGSVLFDGHNSGISRNGVFANLDKLVNGDEIIIERGDGKKFTYKVAENQTVPVRDAITSGMKQLMTPYDDSKEGLGIITDAGNWVPRDKVFEKRILIRAVAE